MRGIPVRIEVGPKDIEAGQAVIVRRDTREKITVSFEELSAKVGEILETMQKEMLERARAHRDAHTYTATNYEEFKDILANKPGFVKAMWCGDRACEDKEKEELSATSRYSGVQPRTRGGLMAHMHLHASAGKLADAVEGLR